MKMLNNSDDITLVDFLLALPSAGEVQEYVELYLGKTARAQAFAAELIRQKRNNPKLSAGLGVASFAGVGGTGNEPDEEDWEGAGGLKGGGRRKTHKK